MSQAAFRMTRVNALGLVPDMAATSLRDQLRGHLFIGPRLWELLDERLFDKHPRCLLSALWVLRGYRLNLHRSADLP